MPTSITEIAKFLYEEELLFKVNEDDDTIIAGFSTKNYVNRQGDNNLLIVIKLEEDGEYIKIFSPQAFTVPKKMAPLFAQACAMVQWKTKLIQFEYDESDGEIRPIIEFPIEDSILTRKQLSRCIKGMIHIMDEYYHTLSRVIDEGVIEFDDRDTFSELGALLDALPSDLLEQALRRKRGLR